mmetsp:Transcript_14809/g.46562  ORF Transcript_14809/g.46562 Transcript_14809/m.46562 type:complete len:265 (+) Transcript_14809:1793-2587(+)
MSSVMASSRFLTKRFTPWYFLMRSSLAASNFCLSSRSRSIFFWARPTKRGALSSMTSLTPSVLVASTSVPLAPVEGGAFSSFSCGSAVGSAASSLSAPSASGLASASSLVAAASLSVASLSVVASSSPPKAGTVVAPLRLSMAWSALSCFSKLTQPKADPSAAASFSAASASSPAIRLRISSAAATALSSPASIAACLSASALAASAARSSAALAAAFLARSSSAALWGAGAFGGWTLHEVMAPNLSKSARSLASSQSAGKFLT